MNRPIIIALAAVLTLLASGTRTVTLAVDCAATGTYTCTPDIHQCMGPFGFGIYDAELLPPPFDDLLVLTVGLLDGTNVIPIYQLDCYVDCNDSSVTAVYDPGTPIYNGTYFGPRDLYITAFSGKFVTRHLFQCSISYYIDCVGTPFECLGLGDCFGVLATEGVIDPTGIEDAQAHPHSFALHQNVPNPFNPTTWISFDMPPEGGEVTLRVYDVEGNLVRTLADGYQAAGRQTVAWTGKDDDGRDVTSGVYFYRMTAPGIDQTRKMLLLR